MRNVLYLLLFLPSIVFSQRQDLSNDLAFFQKTAEQYDRWLQSIGLNQILRVDKVKLRISDDTELELHLKMTTTYLDMAGAQWKALSKIMSEGKSDTTLLIKLLFNTFIRQFQIPDEQGDIQIYVYDSQGAYIKCFHVFIYSEKGEVKLDQQLNSCKSKPIDVFVTLPPLKTTKGVTKSIRSYASKEAVFEQIRKYAHKKYDHTACYNRFPVFEEDANKTKGNTLVFTFTDLCNEVLKNESKSVWCKLYETFGGNCNDITRERLEFTFNYEPSGANNYRLTGDVKGLFGSGVYKPRDAGYMDMEPDFNDYLSSYMNKFLPDLKNYLQNSTNP